MRKSARAALAATVTPRFGGSQMTTRHAVALSTDAI
jgi:hypothetical protein